MLLVKSFFDLSEFAHKAIFQDDESAWQPLHKLKGYMDSRNYTGAGALTPDGIPLLQTVVLHDGDCLPAEGLQIEYGDAVKGKLVVKKAEQVLKGASVIMAGAVLIGRRIDIGRGVLVQTGAYIQEPAVIGDNTEVRHGAYMRGYCLVGSRCVVGHVTEVKHTIFLDDAKAGHFAYLGDSILGNNVNLGAGTKLANLKFIKGDVTVRIEKGSMSTGLRKLGAILGDNVQTGCNSVTNPGTLLGKNSFLLPNVTAPSGFHRNNSIIR